MASFKKCAENLGREWNGLDPILRDEVLRCFKVVHLAVKDASHAIPKSLVDAAQKLIMAAIPSMVMGAPMEELVIQAAKEIPELSPYVRQILGD
jgi:hypothetical protein